jgi:pyruvate/2-oxoglutarate dehydrogenase complex dihydrolipoamide acyltransferase (E2) component
MSRMAASYLEVMREVARSPDRTILIAGCLPDNIGAERIRAYPKLELWQSSNESRWMSKPLPKSTGIVLMLRFISHPASRSLAGQAKARGIVCTGVLETGDVRQLIDLAFKGVVTPHDEPQSDPSTWPVLTGPTGTPGTFDPKTYMKAPTGRLVTGKPNGAAAPTPSTIPPPGPTETVVPAPLKMKSKVNGLYRHLEALNVNVDALPIMREAERVLPAIQVFFPTMTTRNLAKSISLMRRRAGHPPLPTGRMPKSGIRGLTVRMMEHAAKHPGALAQVNGAVQAPEPPPAPQPQKPQPAPPVVAKAEISIEDALKAIATARTALAAAERALDAAEQSVKATQAGMEETVLKRVEDDVMQALIGIREQRRSKS